MTRTTPERPTFDRADGPDKVTGSGRYTADLTLTGMAHAAFRLAGISHGRITRLDTSTAAAMPGVLTILTQDDVPDVRYGDFVKDRTLFASDVVRYEGEIVAAVAALTPEIARAAAAAIDVQFEQLPAVSDVEAAVADDAPLIHSNWADYESDCERNGNVAALATLSRGDADDALANAKHVLTERYVADPSHAAPAGARLRASAGRERGTAPTRPRNRQ